MVPPVLVKYWMKARLACWAAVKRPGTGPLMSEALPTLIVLLVIPVPFLKPAQDAALATTGGAVAGPPPPGPAGPPVAVPAPGPVPAGTTPVPPGALPVPAVET